LHSAWPCSSCPSNEVERRKKKTFKLELKTIVPSKFSKSIVIALIPETSIKYLQAISQTSSHFTGNAQEKKKKKKNLSEWMKISSARALAASPQSNTASTSQ